VERRKSRMGQNEDTRRTMAQPIKMLLSAHLVNTEISSLEKMDKNLRPHHFSSP
jgi:hypothetical protein